jgi:hypothetical protein
MVDEDPFDSVGLDVVPVDLRWRDALTMVTAGDLDLSDERNPELYTEKVVEW